MSGGFDQECNILAESKEKAISIFREKIGKRFKDLDGWLDKEYLSCSCLNEIYTPEYLVKLDKKIHYTQES